MISQANFGPPMLDWALSAGETSQSQDFRFDGMMCHLGVEPLSTRSHISSKFANAWTRL